MGYVTTELINLFNFLLPGFITSFLGNSLTSFPKKSTFELVVLTLIYYSFVMTRLEPSEEGDFWDVKTAYITRKDSKRNKKPLWERTQSG